MRPGDEARYRGGGGGGGGARSMQPVNEARYRDASFPHSPGTRLGTGMPRSHIAWERG